MQVEKSERQCHCEILVHGMFKCPLSTSLFRASRVLLFEQFGINEQDTERRISTMAKNLSRCENGPCSVSLHPWRAGHPDLVRSGVPAPIVIPFVSVMLETICLQGKGKRVSVAHST